MKNIGRRGSRETGWNWSRNRAWRGSPPPRPPFLPLAAATLLFAAIAAALLAVRLSDSDSVTPPVTASLTATPQPNATSVPSATPLPTAEPTPVPTSTADASLTPVVGARFYLAAWDGTRWRPDPPLGKAIFREGQSVPFLLRIDRIHPSDLISLAVTYGCQAFSSLTPYDRTFGDAPALAEEGPLSLLPDTAVLVPDGAAGEDAQISLWGGLFGRAAEAGPIPDCLVRKEVRLELSAASDTLFLMWGAEIAPGAASRDAPLGLSVRVPALGGPFGIPYEIGTESVKPPRR